jgi:hypothetical protein
LEIKAALSEQELEHWNVLKELVDADDEESKGVLTKEEVMALCELMDEDVTALIEKQDMQEKQLHLDYSPERKETIKVQQQLASLEQKLEAMLGTGATISSNPAAAAAPARQRQQLAALAADPAPAFPLEMVQEALRVQAAIMEVQKQMFGV